MLFYTDEDVPPQFATLARSRGVDILTARDAGMLGRTDREQLAFAGEQGPCLITNNPQDFPQLCDEFEEHNRPHAGVIGCSYQMRPQHVGRAFDALIRLIDYYPDGLVAFAMLYLRW